MPAKIMFYLNTLGIGGAERVMSQLATHFNKAGYCTVFVTSFAQGQEYALGEGIVRYSLEETEIPQSRIKRNVTRITKLRKLCKQENPDVLVSFMQEPNFRAILATVGLPVKTLVSVRNDPNREYAGKLGRFVGKVILPMADACVFQTEDAKAWFPKGLQKKSQVIMNDVKEEFFDIARESTGNVVTVGRLNKQKNHALLIRAYAAIAAKYPDRKLLLYGKGDLHDELHRLIDQLGMQDHISLQGATEDVAGVLSKAGVFVLSSDYEGMPNCLLEALAAGVPSISTDCPCGGPKMLIEHGKNGLLVPVGDEAALTESMDRLLSNPDFAQTLGENARQRAMDYSPEKVFAQWRAFVESLLC